MPPQVAVSTIGFLGRSLVEAVRLTAELADTIEVNFENLHRLQVDYASVLAHYRAALAEAIRLDATPLVLHAPYEEYFLPYLGAGLRRLVEEAKLIIDVVAGYGVRYIVFHPFSAQKVGYDRVEWLNTYFFAEVADHAKTYGVTVAVENTVTARPWNRIEKLVEMVRGVGSSLRICLDVGHANVNGYKPHTIIEKYRDLIAVLHLHDNHGRTDDHLPPGAGNIDWISLGKKMKELNGLAAVIEVSCQNTTETCKSRLIASKTVIENIIQQ